MGFLSNFLVVIVAVTTIVLAERVQLCPFACDPVPCCPDKVDMLFATDGRSCFAFLNTCHLGTENCLRMSRCEKQLEIISKEKCQKLCPDACTKIYSPILAEFVGKRQEFPNECELRRHNCLTGEIWAKVVSNTCKEHES